MMGLKILSEGVSAWRGTWFAKPKLHSSSSEPAGLVRLFWDYRLARARAAERFAM
jgi:hypothetical protein